jgi:hypothetical protein
MANAIDFRMTQICVDPLDEQASAAAWASVKQQTLVLLAEGLKCNAPTEAEVRYRVALQTVWTELKTWTEPGVSRQIDRDHPREGSPNVKLWVQDSLIDTQRGLTNCLQIGSCVERQ